jgi:hypothetical protein
MYWIIVDIFIIFIPPIFSLDFFNSMNHYIVDIFNANNQFGFYILFGTYSNAEKYLVKLFMSIDKLFDRQEFLLDFWRSYT